MKTTIKELSRGADGVRCSIEITGKLPTGKHERERYTRDFPSLGAAREWAKQRVFALIRGEDETMTPLLSKVWEAYEKDYIDVPGELKASSAASKKSIWANHLGPNLGGRRVGEIDFNDILRLKVALSGKSKKTANNVLIDLKALLNFARKQKFIAALPEIEPHKVAKKRIKVYTVEQYNKAVETAAAIGDRELAVVLLAGEAGLRAGEILPLDVTHVGDGVLNLEVSIWRQHEGTTKGNAERGIPLTPRTSAVLARLTGKRKSGPLIRAATHGGRMTYTPLNRLWHRVVERAELPYLSFHKLRHTYGTHVTKLLGIHAAQGVLGHSSVTTTEGYVHIEPDRAIADALEKLRAVTRQPETDASSTTENTE